jgi:hypothetical protein
VKSKKFIDKVMFQAVVMRARFDENGQCIFDGKLGIFSFVKVEPAKRWSPNMDASMENCKFFFLFFAYHT